MRRAAASVGMVLALSACGGATAPEMRGDPSTSVEPPAPTPSPERPCDRYTLIGEVRGRSAAARESPARTADELGRFPRVNAQGATQVFPLLEETYAAGTTWYRALLPMRPNGSTGWIAADDLERRRSDYRLRIDLSRFRLRVFRLCEEVAAYRIGVGTTDTPTPRGTFYLNSLLRPPERGTVYGAYAYGLSAHSGVIRDWEGGGIVGLHGTNDPSSVGRRVSHGCIRMRNEDIRALVPILPLGTLITIR